MNRDGIKGSSVMFINETALICLAAFSVWMEREP